MNSFSAEGTARNPIQIEDYEDVMEAFRDAMEAGLPVPEEIRMSKKKKKKSKDFIILLDDKKHDDGKCYLERYLDFQRRRDAVRWQLQDKEAGRCWYDKNGWHCTTGICCMYPWKPAPAYFPEWIDLSTGVPVPPLEEVRPNY